MKKYIELLILHTMGNIGRVCLVIWVSGIFGYSCLAMEQDKNQELSERSTFTELEESPLSRYFSQSDADYFRVSNTELERLINDTDIINKIEAENFIIRSCIKTGGFYAYNLNPNEFRTNVYSSLSAVSVVSLMGSFVLYYAIPVIIDFS